MDDNTTRESEAIDRFRNFLLVWGEENIRKFPWRYRDDPYAVLVSEFMLHRTQARQVVPIYENFMAQYPTLSDFSEADPDTVRTGLQSLGLGWRINGMIAALKEIWTLYGFVPVDYEKLTDISGIGQYIAGATICFSQNEPQTLVDTNVVRVVGRVFGLNLQGEARRRKEMVEMIGKVCDPEHSRDFYYALIDLAHLICCVKTPECDVCPLREVQCNTFCDS
jgi:A/G-specific adenine glycosylase